jgi:hypothetical protein
LTTECFNHILIPIDMGHQDHCFFFLLFILISVVEYCFTETQLVAASSAADAFRLRPELLELSMEVAIDQKIDAGINNQQHLSEDRCNYKGFINGDK